MTTETLNFQAEVSRLLDIVAHALYSEREVFLRELISNASDACDKLRYEALQNDSLMAGDDQLKITLQVDESAKTLTITDNGIGMDKADLTDHLGTIARSGTANFVKAAQEAAEAKQSAPSLIGQFGVGFYSAFMVAHTVTVQSRRAGSEEAWQWQSNGTGTFTLSQLEAAQAPSRGTRIILALKDDATEFLGKDRLKQIVTRYSDHIAFPVQWVEDASNSDLTQTLNTASALWQRSPKDISAEQYKEFYHHNGHAFDDPWLTLHWHAEGVIDYRALLFVPDSKPLDLFDPKRQHHVKLYVKRVFITDAAEGLIPPYLRFMRGVVDSEDLPLNVSREMLQHNPVLAKIRSGLTKRILGDLAKERSKDSYNEFWSNFGAVLKEGLYEDRDHQALILRLCRFHTTRTIADNGQMIDLETYVNRMAKGQSEIYTISGSDPAALALSPQLEGFKARDIEVLLLTDPVDDFWQASVEGFEGKPFRSVTRGAVDLSAFKAKDSANSDETSDKKDDEAAEHPSADTTALLTAFKEALADSVADVRPSSRLTSSAVCLVAGDGDIDMNLERLLRTHKQLPAGGLKRVLEINPKHPLILSLAAKSQESASNAEAKQDIAEAAHLLLDQARIIEGEPLPDPLAFSTRLSNLMKKGLAA